MESSGQLMVKLSTIPKFVNDIDPQRIYRLIGVGRFKSGHYTALCLTKSNVWLEMDDLARTSPPKVHNDEDMLIIPHLSVYQNIQKV